MPWHYCHDQASVDRVTALLRGYVHDVDKIPTILPDTRSHSISLLWPRKLGWLLRNDLLNSDIQVDVQVAPDMPKVAGDGV